MGLEERLMLRRHEARSVTRAGILFCVVHFTFHIVISTAEMIITNFDGFSFFTERVHFTLEVMDSTLVLFNLPEERQ